MDNQSIAIVGLACRFPGSADLGHFWDNMLAGRNGITTFCANHSFLSENIKDNTNTPIYHAGIIEQCAYFDRRFFGFSLQQASYIDPQYRWLLETIWHALEDARMPANSLYGKRVGVYLGIGTHEYQVAVHQHLLKQNNMEANFATLLSSDEHWIGNYLSRVYGWHGQSMVINSGDNTTFSALELACNSLLTEEIDIAIIGTANMLSSHYLHALSESALESQRGYCASFDLHADGLVCGEGCGVVILKRLHEVKQDKQEAYALIKGYAHDQSVIPHASAMSWNAQGQQQVMQLALLRSGVRIEDIHYIEANGLGLLAADEAEIKAIVDFFKSRSHKEKPCPIGSVKNHIGYLQNASGMASLIRAALILKYKQIPGAVHHVRAKDSLLAQHDASKLLALTDKISNLHEGEIPSCVLVHGFNFFADHHALILQEIRSPMSKTVPIIRQPDHENTLQLLVVSGKSVESLQDLLFAYRDMIKKNSALSLSDLCFSSQITRDHQPLRLAFLVQSLQGLDNLLQIALEQHEQNKVYSEHIDSSIDKTPRTTALKRLANSYCQGLLVDWSEMSFTESAQKIALPLYMFHQQVCWIDDVLKIKGMIGSDEETLDTRQSEQEINLAAEAEHYVHDIMPHHVIEKSDIIVNAILLTGATGGFGPFLLNELLQKTNSIIYCLVRADSQEQALQRLRTHIMAHIDDQKNLERLIALPGDIEKPLLGLDKSTYEKLAHTIDSIYHGAVDMNWILPYQKMKAVNVIGTANILTFAVHKKTKLMNYMSSLGVLMPLGYHHPSALTEEVNIDLFSNHPTGYYSSKWVAEKMVQLLQHKNLPVNIFRPAFMGCDHGSAWLTMRHLFGEIISCCLELGCFPLYEGELEFIAPDELAKKVAQLSLRPHPLDKSIFHLNAQGHIAWNEVYDLLAEQGIHLHKIEYINWKRVLVKASVKNKTLLRFLPLFFDSSNNLHQNLFEYFIQKKPITTDVNVSALMPIVVCDAQYVRSLYGNYIKHAIRSYKAQQQHSD